MEDREVELLCDLSRLKSCPEDHVFEIVNVPAMGRGAFAKADIRQGDVLDEQPLVDSIATDIVRACEGRIHNNMVNLITTYTNSGPDIRGRICGLTLAHSPEEAKYIEKRTAIWQRLAEKIYQNSSLIRSKITAQQEIVELMTRSHLNAHGFGPAGHVLLEVGALLNHSCSPNVSFSTVTTPTRRYMKFYAIKAIKSGEQLFSVYIGGVDMLKSTERRREQLREEKAFLCKCSRCSAPDVLAPLPCPLCRGTCLRHDYIELPWVCQSCGRRFWDAEVTSRQTQLERLVLNVDTDMNNGRFPPLQITLFLVRDCVEDLSATHYLTLRARALLEECFAFKEIIGAQENGQMVVRCYNAWQYVSFLMSVIWEISPVVAVNMCTLRLRFLLGQALTYPPGVSPLAMTKLLRKAERILCIAWGDKDEDAANYRAAIARSSCCRLCQDVLAQRMVVCPKCSYTNYCSRKCLLEDRVMHGMDCDKSVRIAALAQIELANCH